MISLPSSITTLSLSLSLSLINQPENQKTLPPAVTMEFYTEGDKWKHPKDESTSNNYSLKRSISQKTSASKSPFLRSFSLKSSSFKSPPLSSSSSSPNPIKTSSSSSSSSSSLSRSSSHKCSDFAKKCSGMAKEQRAKFYIMKRCVKMLVFWNNKNGDS
ncbi:unnamed protein product [Camellia sinensis]